MSQVYVNVGVDGRSIPAGGESGQVLQKASDEDFDLIWTTPAGGTSANIPQPTNTKSPKDGGTDGTGTVGTSVAYARQDHAHPINVATSGVPSADGTASLGTAYTYAKSDHVHPLNEAPSGTPEMDGTAAIGTSFYYALFDHVHPVDTSRASATDMTAAQGNITSLQSAVTAITASAVSITLTASEGDWTEESTEVYSQAVTLSDVTAKTKVDLTPDSTTVLQMVSDGTYSIYIENNSGTLTAIAVGDAPTATLTISGVRYETA